MREFDLVRFECSPRKKHTRDEGCRDAYRANSDVMRGEKGMHGASQEVVDNLSL